MLLQAFKAGEGVIIAHHTSFGLFLALAATMAPAAAHLISQPTTSLVLYFFQGQSFVSCDINNEINGDCVNDILDQDTI